MSKRLGANPPIGVIQGTERVIVATGAPPAPDAYIPLSDLTDHLADAVSVEVRQAAQQAGQAAASAGDAATAAAADREAAQQAAADAARSMVAVSSTTLTVGTGTRTLTVGEGKMFAPGQPVRIADAADPAGRYMDGVVTSYAGGELVVAVSSSLGAGSGSDWVVSMTGATGAAGEVSLADLDQRLLPAITTADFIPVSGTTEKVTVWLEKGGRELRAMGLTPRLRKAATKDVITKTAGGRNKFPISHAGRRVTTWWDSGFAVARLSEDFRRMIQDSVDGSVFAPAVAPPAARIPVSTDGRSLHRVRAKLADLSTSPVSPSALRIGLAGDSWHERGAIPNAFRTLLDRRFTRVGEGWQSVSTSNKIGGVAFARSAGWTLIDGSNLAAMPYGTGIDGFCLYASGAANTATLSNWPGTRLMVFYRQTSGAFRYRINGGTWIPVVGDGSGALGVVEVSGLAVSGTHTLDLDTQGNTGVAALLGFYVDSGVGGYILNKIGNEGLRTDALQQWIGDIGPVAARLDLDVVIVAQGTNDYRSTYSPPSAYLNVLRQLISQYRSAQPDIGIIFIAPPDSNGIAVTPLTAYRDALYQLSREQGVELLDLHDIFGTYAQSNALSQWADNLHLSARGAMNQAAAILRTFFNM